MSRSGFSLAWLLLLACASEKSGTDASEDPSDAPVARDAELRDSADAGIEDVLPLDAEHSTPDAGTPDGGTSDADTSDGDTPDAGPEAMDADSPDVMPCVPGSVPSGLEPSQAPPDALSSTGLYSDIVGKQLGPQIRSFAPKHVLWSDGAEKARWVYLPECSVIDTTDMNHWSVPVGTRLFKEFVRDGKRIETRVISRFGPGDDDFWFATYLWVDDESEAISITLGMPNARGTQHDVPAVAFCANCHSRSPEQILGFSAVQLDHDASDVTLFELAADGHLSQPPSRHHVTPGSTEVAAGLGYLHANCGNCHNETERAVVFLRPMNLRLSFYDGAVEDTGVYRTAANIEAEKFLSHPGVTHRLLPGNVDASAIGWRITIRSVEQMPPIATELVDPVGIDEVHGMILSFP
ncbi:MAG: hypothetical protein HY791_20565 [Deltaproteobacteria bacterium]|nr:hypothetical protein [Deltaproteobacteria bacterium]